MTFEANNTVAMTVSGGNIGLGTEPTGLAPYTQLVVPGKVPTALAGTAPLGANPCGLYVQGRYAYATSSASNELQVFDVSNTTPVLVSTTTLPGSPGQGGRLTVQGKYLYVAITSGSLLVYDVSNPTLATLPLVGSANNATTGSFGVYAQGQYAYVVSGSAGTNLQIYDISNPAFPLLVSTLVRDPQQMCMCKEDTHM